MRYVEYAPSAILKPYVKSLAIQEGDAENSYHVFPQTGLVLGFQYRGRLSHLKGLEEECLSVAGVSGLTDRYSIFRASANIGTVLVYFREAGAAAFFRTPIHELFNERLALDHFIGHSEVVQLEERLSEAPTDEAKIQAVTAFLIRHCSETPIDPVVLTALQIIHQHQGNIRINHLADRLHIGISALEKRFRRTVGTSPKKFALIVRLEYLTQSTLPADRLWDAVYASGFYDQSHFIKAFRNFTGQTPESFFR